MSAKNNPSFAELNELRRKNKDCDVTIEIDGKYFPCHRVVLRSSPFFKAMFDGDFSESKSNFITLREIDATTFQQILEAMYTGTITIDTENACNLLKASSFLGLHEFEKTCIAFTEKNHLIDNLIEVCVFAHVLQEKKLYDGMVKCIADNFSDLCKIRDFSNLPMLVFEAILSQETTNRDEDVVFNEIVKWVTKNIQSHSIQHIQDLLEAAKLTKINVSMLAKLLSFAQMPKEDVNVNDDTGTDNSNSNENIAITYAPRRPTIKVYLKATTLENGSSNNFISLAYQPLNKNKWALAKTFNCPFDNLKTVVVGNRQYFLSYCAKNSNEDLCKFWMVKDEKLTTLRKPPAIDEHYELLALKNTIFLYFTDLKARIIDDSVKNFTQTNITHLYFYNCEANKWFAAPDMNQPVKGAALVGHDDNLYLIGGLRGSNFEDCIQRWDARRLNWDCISHSYLQFCYGSACLYKDDVYLSGSYYNNEPSAKFYKYDISRNQLLTLKEMGRVRANHTLIGFNDALYAIDNNCNIPFSSIEKYDFTYPEKWVEEPSLPRKIVSDDGEFWTCEVTAAVVSPFLKNEQSFKIW